MKKLTIFVLIVMLVASLALTSCSSSGDATGSSAVTSEASAEASAKASEEPSAEASAEASAATSSKPAEDTSEEPQESTEAAEGDDSASASGTVEASEEPSADTSEEASAEPAEEPSEEPSEEASEEPSEEPSEEVSEEPSEEVSEEPEATIDDNDETEPGEEESPAATGGTFKVGMECNYAPFNWTQADEGVGTVPIAAGGYAGGYDVEIAKKIAEGLGRELEIVKTEWDGLIPALQSGKIDAVIAGMSPTEERRMTVDFTAPYYVSKHVIVVNKDGDYAGATSIADFSGAKITGQLNTLHYDIIDQIEGVNKQTAMKTFPQMIVALQSGKIDGYVSELPGAVSAAASNPDLTYIEFDEGNGFEVSEEDAAIAVALAKDSPDLEAIDEIISAITEEERIQLMNDAVANQPIVVDGEDAADEAPEEEPEALIDDATEPEEPADIDPAQAGDDAATEPEANASTDEPADTGETAEGDEGTATE